MKISGDAKQNETPGSGRLLSLVRPGATHTIDLHGLFEWLRKQKPRMKISGDAKQNKTPGSGRLQRAWLDRYGYCCENPVTMRASPIFGR